MSRIIAAAIFSVLLLGACKQLPADVVEYNQTFNAGKAYYQDECSRCHKDSGEGVGTLYPPLANSDYLKEHIDDLPCIIYNGMNRQITVNGKQYNWAMPGHINMDDYEMAALVTYVRNKWGIPCGRVNMDQARTMIIRCRTLPKPKSGSPSDTAK